MNQFYEDEVVLIADENSKAKRNIPMSEITKDSFEEVFNKIKKICDKHTSSVYQIEGLFNHQYVKEHIAYCDVNESVVEYPDHIHYIYQDTDCKYGYIFIPYQDKYIKCYYAIKQ